jgi:hypothetical protein
MLLANEIRELSRKLPRHDPVTGLSITVNNGVATVQGWGTEAGETTVDDIDDIDDLDALIFGEGGDFPGPIDAFGEVVPDVNIYGEVSLDDDDNIRTLQGWSQQVTVEKVDPYNFATVRAPSYAQTRSGQLPAIAPDAFPLRVTVRVFFQDTNADEATEVTRMTWILPAE